MKLNRLKSIVNQAIRDSCATSKGYMLDPFHHYTPEYKIEINLLNGSIKPEREGDDVEVFYMGIISWFHEVLLKEGIPIEIIDEAIIVIDSLGKQCAIKAKGKVFKVKKRYK